jgi:putative FmdB family regulatory protein
VPLYEYRCRECGERFEVLQRLGQGGDELTCPRCGEPRPERVLSTFASTTGGQQAAPNGGGGCCRGTFT